MKYRVHMSQPAIEHLMCDVDADSPEEALAIANREGDWEHQFNDSGLVQHDREFVVTDEDGNTVLEEFKRVMREDKADPGKRLLEAMRIAMSFEDDSTYLEIDRVDDGMQVLAYTSKNMGKAQAASIEELAEAIQTASAASQEPKG